MKNIFKKLGTASNIALFTFCYSYNVLAAPGTLVQSPLFLTNTVEPNIYFTYDDSNSMGYETVIDSDFVIAPDFVTKFEIQNGKVMMDEKNADGEEKPIAKIFYSDLGRPSYKGVIPPKSVMTGTWVFRTHYSNSIYYNPNQTYETWKMAGCEYSEYTTELNDGKLELNVPATPPPPTDDACSRATAATYNLLEPRNYSHDYDLSDNSEDGEVDPTVLTGTIYIPTYYTWHDDDGDGVMDPREGTKIEIKEDTNSYSHDGGRTDCASTTSCTFAREIQNFSNWFVFNRSREGVAKAALAEVIINSDSVRMALEAMHTNDSGSPLTELVSMDDNTKNAMLTALYSRDTYAKTPTREALKRVGDRFKDITNGTVILSAKEGGACQQNFNILVTDGFWTGSNHDGDDATDFTFTTFPNADAYSADNAFDGNAEESNDGGNYADTHENTLADVAMYYYKTDLRPEGQPSPLENLVPVPTKGVTYRGEDKPNHQHLVTYAIGFGLEGSLDTDIDPTHLSFGGWPDPDDAGDIVTKEKNARVDDLWHAAYNSRGLYFSASNSAELSDALKDSIEAIAGDTATATAAAVNVSRLAEGSKVYFTEFNSDGWYGTIDAHNVVEDGNFLTLVDSGVSAAERLAAKTIADRVILTYDADNSEGVEFKLPDNATDLTATDLTATDLTAEMKADLHTGPNGEPDGLGVARLQYIRGDHTKEVSEADGYLRQRPTLSSNGQTSVLGDIVHSSPVYVGTPDIGWPDVFPVNNPSKPYSEFVSESTRSGVIYAGANDGMLHGFDSTTLEELMAYIPSNLFSSNPGEGLHYLTEPDYNHRYYVDLTPSISDVFINGAWHTILVGGQRAGGKGYFALDITDPDSFGTDDVMWEFTHADLGYTYSQPQIGMMNDGSWVAIFGNGYNNGGSGEAELFIVDIETGELIKKITTGVGIPVDGTGDGRNGLATPALADLDLNGTIDRAYAGDLEGNMWVFDLSGSSPSDWDLDYKLFTTEAGEPITSKPTLSFHPTVRTIAEPDDDANEPNVMVFFGSGQYLVESDLVVADDATDNYFYGVWDKKRNPTLVSPLDLVEQTISTETYSYTDTNDKEVDVEYRLLTKNSVDYASKDGWKIALPDTGERIVTNPVVRGDVVYFNSSVPKVVDDPCSNNGYGYRFGVDLATGGTANRPVFDTNHNGIVNEDDTNDTGQIPSASYLDSLPTDPTMTEEDVIQGGKIYDLQDLHTPKTGRFSWQELLQ